MNPVSSKKFPCHHPVQADTKKTNENSNLIDMISEFASSLLLTSNSYESDPQNIADQKVLEKAREMLSNPQLCKTIKPADLNSPSEGDSNVATTLKTTTIAINIFTRNTNTNPTFDDNQWPL